MMAVWRSMPESPLVEVRFRLPVKAMVFVFSIFILVWFRWLSDWECKKISTELNLLYHQGRPSTHATNRRVRAIGISRDFACLFRCLNLVVLMIGINSLKLLLYLFIYLFLSYNRISFTLDYKCTNFFHISYTLGNKVEDIKLGGISGCIDMCIHSSYTKRVSIIEFKANNASKFCHYKYIF